jgi:hypothetical protein
MSRGLCCAGCFASRSWFAALTFCLGLLPSATASAADAVRSPGGCQPSTSGEAAAMLTGLCGGGRVSLFKRARTGCYFVNRFDLGKLGGGYGERQMSLCALTKLNAAGISVNTTLIPNY